MPDTFLSFRSCATLDSADGGNNGGIAGGNNRFTGGNGGGGGSGGNNSNYGSNFGGDSGNQAGITAICVVLGFSLLAMLQHIPINADALITNKANNSAWASITLCSN